MEEREISVRELIKGFVGLSYFREVRMFNYSMVLAYITRCYNNGSEEYQKRVNYEDLCKELDDILKEMLQDDTLTLIYKDERGKRLYWVNKSKNNLEVAKYDKEYIEFLGKAFMDIIGGADACITLTTSKSVKK